MNEPGRGEIADAPLESSSDCNMLIASLRIAGAEKFDPVRWRFIEALAKRAIGHQGNVKRLLDARLAHALAGYRERFDRALSDAGETVAQSVRRYPDAAGDLQRLLDAGDFKELRRYIGTLNAGEQSVSLGALVRHLEQNSLGNADMSIDANVALRPELRTIKNFRNTWSKLSVDKQVLQALAHAPRNAGPINSHMLVLRSLAMMRDIAPDYLNRFVSYADTLLFLDQDEKEKLIEPKKRQRSGKK